MLEDVSLSPTFFVTSTSADQMSSTTNTQKTTCVAVSYTHLDVYKRQLFDVYLLKYKIRLF